jgi:hypothetical protein
MVLEWACADIFPSFLLLSHPVSRKKSAEHRKNVNALIQQGPCQAAAIENVL